MKKRLSAFGIHMNLRGNRKIRISFYGLAALTLIFSPFSARIALATPPNAIMACNELFISEYIEGSSYNKAIEIYNGTGSAIDLSTYTLELYSNGSATPSQDMSLSGTLNTGDVYIIAHNSAAQAILDEADVTNRSVVNFNGNDAVVLKHNDSIIDVIGQVGFDPGTEWGTDPTSTLNHTLRRKATIGAGDNNANDAFDPADQWDGYSIDDFSGLGSHTYSPTAIDLASFTAVPVEGGIDVTWETATELDNLGFNLYRGTTPGGPFDRLNATLIPPQNPGQVLGATYTWLDDDVASGNTYYYLLEDVDIGGTATTHGPVSASPQSPTALSLTGIAAHSSGLAALAPVAALAAIVVAGEMGIHTLRRRNKK